MSPIFEQYENGASLEKMQTLRPLHQNSGLKHPENRHYERALATRRYGGLASPDLYRAHLHEEAAAQRLIADAHKKTDAGARMQCRSLQVFFRS